MESKDASLYLADYYFSILETLSDNAKLYLMKKLADSMFSGKKCTDKKNYEVEKDSMFNSLAGAWANDPEAEYISKAIKEGKSANNTRHIVPLD